MKIGVTPFYSQVKVTLLLLPTRHEGFRVHIPVVEPTIVDSLDGGWSTW